MLTAYRLSTFPLIHLNFIHTFLNVLALTPLMERFENEYGTLTSLALFFGRKILITRFRATIANTSVALTTIPAVLYLIIERFILRGNVAIMGARWVHQRIDKQYEPC